MANLQHVEIARKGAKAIAEWRAAHPDQQLDLGGATLGGADLSHANLTRADLREATLSWADLSGANFYQADLFRANLGAAILTEANLGAAFLVGVSLFRADLSRASLTGTDLTVTMFSDTTLDQTGFARARFANTVVANCDLSTALGLEDVIHVFPSSIGLDTVVRSMGKIPEAFLRGVGFPDSVIKNIGSLVPGQFPNCFISYSHQDQEFADKLYDDLQARGVRCWLASEDLKIGDPFRNVIDREVRQRDKLLLVLSEHSIGSQWVEKEVETALEKERQENQTVLFPIRLGEAVMNTDKAWAADIRRTRHIGDFRQWTDPVSYQRSLRRLLRDLAASQPTPTSLFTKG